MTADDQRAAEAVDITSAEAVFRAAGETHRGGAHAAMVAEVDRLRAELAETRAAGDAPTVGWVTRATDTDLLLHAQVVWQQLRKRELAEPKTIEAREWAGTHLRVVRALEARTAAGDALADAVDERDTVLGPLSREVQAWRSVRGDAPTDPPAVPLPVTLSSVDDVAAVAWLRDVVAGKYPTWVDTVEHAPALLAAIEADRGGSR